MIHAVGEKIDLPGGQQMSGFGLGCYKAQGEELVQAIRWAVQTGYRMFDTATRYLNEDQVGRGIRSCGLVREQVCVVSKLWPTSFERPQEGLRYSLRQLDIGYIDGYLRLSVVGDPLRRENTGDNTPCILYTSVVPGDKVKITVAPKGFGSENMTQMKMFTPAATKAQIVDFIADACIHAGSNPCPPIVIGVGLGGTSDKAAYLAKRALLRPVDQHNADPLYAEMEQQILDKVNASGVGPQGLGGTVTALACAIEPFGTHIAGLPCVVNISCHVTRHAEGEL